jgi:hypothetical protein
MLVMGRPWWNNHSFPSDFVTWSCWLWDDRREIIFDFPQTLSLSHVGYGTAVGKLSLISLRLCHVVMLFMVNYHWFPSDFVTWSCLLWLIVIDFPQTLSLGYVGYGKLSLISFRLCHVVMLVKGNYHWFPSDFVTWSCWLWEIIIDFPQTLSLGHVGYGKLSLISLILCHLVMLVISRDWKKSEFCCLF